MPFCYSPWLNIDISPSGRITPCCKFQIGNHYQTYTIEQNSIDDYINSNFLKKVKEDFNNNIWPKGCERCQIDEANGVDSKRILDYARWSSHYKTVDLSTTKFITASVAFGNTCNLKCISCSPYSSSRWHQEYKTIYNIDIPHFDFYKENFVQEFIKFTPNIIHIDIPGGEPLLSGVKEQKELLKYYINNKQADTISLHYTTNGSVFPDNEWWNLWKHFKEIDLQISVDGIESRYEYLRYPSKWDNFVANTKQYIEKEKLLKNLRLSVSHTVSAYNIFYLDEFFTWCYNIGLPKPWLGRVHMPAHMRPTVWPDNVKKIIIEHLRQSKHYDIKNWINVLINTDDSEFFETFKEKIQQHDNYRKLEFKTTFPELASYV